MKKITTSTRRGFLKSGAVATGLLLLPAGFLRGNTAPSNRVNLACVGAGGMGRWDIPAFARAGAKIAALCDVDSQALDKAAAKYSGAKTFRDYREMLDKVGRDVDAVSVSIPDHAHFTVAWGAVSLGKHVYVQKPLCHTIDQVRRLSRLAAEKKIISQMGNQGQSSAHIRKAKEWYEAGLLGEVSRVEVWTDRPGWPQGMDAYRPAEPAPAHLDWNLWLGPAASRPYSPGLAPNDWRGYYEFGCGALGDMGIHLINDAFYVLDLTNPDRVSADTRERGKVAFPKSSTLTFNFPANAKRGPVELVWYDGGRRPDPPAAARAIAAEQPSNGCYLHGKKFTLSLCGWGNTFEPLVEKEAREQLFRNSPPEKYPRIKGGHYQNWVDSIRAGTPAVSDFSNAGPFAEVILLGVIAQRLGRTLRWDAAAAQFTGDAAATALVKAPPPRAGFKA